MDTAAEWKRIEKLIETPAEESMLVQVRIDYPHLEPVEAIWAYCSDCDIQDSFGEERWHLSKNFARRADRTIEL